jgi:hypothetical protein
MESPEGTTMTDTTAPHADLINTVFHDQKHGLRFFEKNERATLKPRLKRDIYVYKTWASLDGKTWQRGNALVAGRIEFRLPGETDGRAAGKLRVEFNQK